MGESRAEYRVLGGNSDGKRNLEDAGIDGRIVLRWIFMKWNLGYGLDRAVSG